jgi:hypothetical protein
MNRANCANKGQSMGLQELQDKAQCWYWRPRSPYPIQMLESQEQETKDYTYIFRQASRSVFGLLLGDLTGVQDLKKSKQMIRAFPTD